MCLVQEKSILELLQQADGHVSCRATLPHLGDDFTLPLHVCLALSDVTLNHLLLCLAFHHRAASFPVSEI